MKKLPVLATILLIAGVVASLAFAHPISSQNGVVRDYSPGATLTLDTASGPHTYILRNSTLMWGWGATSFVANTGGSASSSSSSTSSSSSSSSSTATATAAPSTAGTATATPSTGGTTATATPSTGSSSSSSSSTTTSGAAMTVNGLGTGARVTVFAECFPGTAFRHMNTTGMARSSRNANNNTNQGQNNVCFALAVIVRAPANAAVPATGGTSAPASPTAAATTETPTAMSTETPAVTMTPTP